MGDDAFARHWGILHGSRVTGFLKSKESSSPSARRYVSDRKMCFWSKKVFLIAKYESDCRLRFLIVTHLIVNKVTAAKFHFSVTNGI